MKRKFYSTLATIALMGLAYYLYNPRKYNKGVKKMGGKMREKIHTMKA